MFTSSSHLHMFIPLHHHWFRGGAVAVAVAVVPVALPVAPALLLLLLLLLLLQRPPPFLLLNALSALWAIWARSKHRANGILEKLCVQCAVAAKTCKNYNVSKQSRCLDGKCWGCVPFFAPCQELRNARKFVERQELFEKKYMIGSKLGEQAPGTTCTPPFHTCVANLEFSWIIIHNHYVSQISWNHLIVRFSYW